MASVPDVTPELPPRSAQIALAAVRALPRRSLSRAFGRIADVPLPRIARAPVLRAFAALVGADRGEAELPLEDYPSLNAFFVRRLRPGSRRWPSDPRVLASPVDGIIGAVGRVDEGRALQAKGHDYTVADLLTDGDEAARFDGGVYVTIYLSPRHYHRIHTPCPGRIARAIYVPGDLYPVNAPAVMRIPRLFVRNERLICFLEGERGRIAVVAVGAYNVGRISAAFDPAWSGSGREEWITNRRVPPPRERRYDPPKEVMAGAEIMAFHLGSTVVLLAESGVDIAAEVVRGREVRVGERISTG